MEARFNERIKQLEGQELYDYIGQIAPFIAEYTMKTDKGIQRKDIYERYLTQVEGELLHIEKPRRITHCTCGSDKLIHEQNTSDMVCTECGRTHYILSQEVGFKDEQEMDKQIIYSYDRKNHFNEWLAQFQAKEHTAVPKEIIEQLRIEFRKQKIKTLDEITHGKVRTLLKKLKLNKYYEHVPYIATILNGHTPPNMPQALEDRLRIMFHQIQEPFQKHCPSDRKNFLSYSYVLYKFCELLSEDQYLSCFPLLKDKSKVYQHDKIWKKICDDLRWEFIPTV